MTKLPTDTHVADIDWASWVPVDLATLLFVRDGSRVLLMVKKRGLGAGLINAPGGRLEPGETPRQAALREVEEELGVCPRQAIWAGEHRFAFCDGYSMYVHVYWSDGADGEVIETDEAIPHWVEQDAIPYEQMWADDRIWIPHLLAGRRFSGRYVFDGARMVDHVVELLAHDATDGDVGVRRPA
jgi:8-oxo-dGTP diphosphatase